MLRRANNHRIPRFLAAILAAVALAAGAEARSARAASLEFDVQFSREIRPEPFTGRVYLFFSRGGEPRLGPDWFRPDPFVAMDVTDWKPGETLTFSTAEPETMLAYPEPLGEMDLSDYRVQAVARFNPYEREVGTGPGNGYSSVQAVDSGVNAAPLAIDRLAAEPKFPETERIRLLDVRSQLLSEFHGRDVHLKAAVILPDSYADEPERRYPTIFIIPGFGGSHRDVETYLDYLGEESPAEGGVEFVKVLLDPSCPLGHHVFADSANNGPVGQALVRELVPAYDRQYRSIAQPGARFLTGHSSGGWSSLWVQIAHPDFFGGTWSTAPDPVDFRDFQQINLYRRGENMYVDAEGRPRPLARHDGRVVIWYRDFARMEWTLGHGGQLHSFEAVFSPRGEDGRPRLLWDRETGEIAHEMARSWEAYDIRLVLERNWATLGPKLRGKLHVFMGDQDTFYLEGATKLLKKSLAELGSDAVVELHPGKDHSTLMTRELRQRIRRDMERTFLEKFPQ